MALRINQIRNISGFSYWHACCIFLLLSITITAQGEETKSAEMSGNLFPHLPLIYEAKLIKESDLRFKILISLKNPFDVTLSNLDKSHWRVGFQAVSESIDGVRLDHISYFKLTKGFQEQALYNSELSLLFPGAKTKFEMLATSSLGKTDSKKTGAKNALQEEALELLPQSNVIELNLVIVKLEKPKKISKIIKINRFPMGREKEMWSVGVK